MLKNLQVVIYSKLPKKNHVIMCNLMNNMPEKITAITNILTVSACFLLYSSDLLKHNISFVKLLQHQHIQIIQ